MKTPGIPQDYLSYQITYHNANSDDELDVVILDPHGHHGFEHNGFFSQHPKFLEDCMVTRQQVEKLCQSESDRYAPEIGERVADILAGMQYRVAFFRILLPRELVDANRIPERAIKWLFDHQKYPEWERYFMSLYQEAIKEEQQVLSQLGSHGKFVAIHSMRQFNIHPEYEYMMEPPTDLQSAKQWMEYYERKLDFLKSPEMQLQEREHCLLTSMRETGEIIADPALTKAMEASFKTHGIKYDLNDPYAYEPFIKESELLRQYNGISIDVVKDQLSIINGASDLANLTENPEALEEMSQAIALGIDEAINKI